MCDECVTERCEMYDARGGTSARRSLASGAPRAGGKALWTRRGRVRPVGTCVRAAQSARRCVGCAARLRCFGINSAVCVVSVEREWSVTTSACPAAEPWLSLGCGEAAQRGRSTAVAAIHACALSARSASGRRAGGSDCMTQARYDSMHAVNVHVPKIKPYQKALLE